MYKYYKIYKYKQLLIKVTGRGDPETLTGRNALKRHVVDNILHFHALYTNIEYLTTYLVPKIWVCLSYLSARPYAGPPRCLISS